MYPEQKFQTCFQCCAKSAFSELKCFLITNKGLFDMLIAVQKRKSWQTHSMQQNIFFMALIEFRNK